MCVFGSVVFWGHHLIFACLGKDSPQVSQRGTIGTTCSCICVFAVSLFICWGEESETQEGVGSKEAAFVLRATNIVFGLVDCGFTNFICV